MVRSPHRPMTISTRNDVNSEAKSQRVRRGRPVERFLYRAGTVVVCLGVLTACGIKSGADWYDDYSKPGTSRKETRAAINQCRQGAGR